MSPLRWITVVGCVAAAAGAALAGSSSAETRRSAELAAGPLGTQVVRPQTPVSCTTSARIAVGVRGVRTSKYRSTNAQIYLTRTDDGQIVNKQILRDLGTRLKTTYLHLGGSRASKCGRTYEVRYSIGFTAGAPRRPIRGKAPRFDVVVRPQ